MRTQKELVRRRCGELRHKVNCHHRRIRALPLDARVRELDNAAVVCGAGNDDKVLCAVEANTHTHTHSEQAAAVTIAVRKRVAAQQ